MNKAFNYFIQTTFKHNEMYTDYQLDDQQQKVSKEVFIIAIAALLIWEIVISPFSYVGFYFIEDLKYFFLPNVASLFI